MCKCMARTFSPGSTRQPIGCFSLIISKHELPLVSVQFSLTVFYVHIVRRAFGVTTRCVPRVGVQSTPGFAYLLIPFVVRDLSKPALETLFRDRSRRRKSLHPSFSIPMILGTCCGISLRVCIATYRSYRYEWVYLTHRTIQRIPFPLTAFVPGHRHGLVGYGPATALVGF